MINTAYERLEMALHDREILRTMACGIAGLSVVADSLVQSSMRSVRPIRNENGIAVDFEIEGEYPQYGNNDERVDRDRRAANGNVHEQAAQASRPIAALCQRCRC